MYEGVSIFIVLWIHNRVTQVRQLNLLSSISIISGQSEPRVVNNLVEWVGSGSPVGEEQAETNGFEHAGQNTDGDCVDRSVLSDEGRDELEISQWVITRHVDGLEHTEGEYEAAKTKPPR